METQFKICIEEKLKKINQFIYDEARMQVITGDDAGQVCGRLGKKNPHHGGIEDYKVFPMTGGEREKFWKISNASVGKLFMQHEEDRKREIVRKKLLEIYSWQSLRNHQTHSHDIWQSIQEICERWL